MARNWGSDRLVSNPSRSVGMGMWWALRIPHFLICNLGTIIATPRVILSMKKGRGPEGEREAGLRGLRSPGYYHLPALRPVSLPPMKPHKYLHPAVLRCSINCSCDALWEPRRKGAVQGPGIINGTNKLAGRNSVLQSFSSPQGFSDHCPKSGGKCFQKHTVQGQTSWLCKDLAGKWTNTCADKTEKMQMVQNDLEKKNHSD